MDVLRKEIYEIYESQRLAEETLDADTVSAACSQADVAANVGGGCCVVTDAASDCCYITGGPFCRLAGLTCADSFSGRFDSGDEDIIYSRLHPEDLVEKRMLELEFFSRMKAIGGAAKLDYKACCTIRIRNHDGEYMAVANTTQVFALSPAGKMWLILCTYNVSPYPADGRDIGARIVNIATGEVSVPPTGNRRARILTPREKEILELVRQGKPSKQIADILAISTHTVNRHRQNIIAKLSVGNIVEAITAASLMKLL